MALFLLIPVFVLGAAFWQSGPREEPLHVAGSDAGYVSAESCQSCHAEIYETYQHTGMGRSFYRMRPEKAVEDWTGNNVYYHEASKRYYTMFERDGRYFQRRHQNGYGGREVNVVEKEIHFVVGSGNRSRTYLHHSPDGKLFELPVAVRLRYRTGPDDTVVVRVADRVTEVRVATGGRQLRSVVADPGDDSLVEID